MFKSIIFSLILVNIMANIGFAKDFVDVYPGAEWGWTDAIVVHEETNLSDNTSIRVIQAKDKTYHIVYNGQINNFGVNILKEMIPEIREANNSRTGKNYVARIYLHSYGGYLQAGIDMGNLFAKHSVSARVTHKSTCASSCAIAFTGARYKDIKGNGKLIFHAPYKEGNYGTTVCATKDDVPELITYINNNKNIDSAEAVTMKDDAFHCDPNGGVSFGSNSIFND